ncbi:MAG TPA: hypothetical protein VMY37_17750 [Thermoguttaceae bacterium]|nr:hypothetical protein [Thermoguttaceae bacterium]
MGTESFCLGGAPQGLCARSTRAKVGYFRGEKRDVQRIALRLFRRRLETWEYAGLAGAPDDAEVEVGTYNAGLYVEMFQPVTSCYHVVQLIRRADDGPVVVIDAFRVCEPMRQKGLGSAIFARQLAAASALGAKRIETVAGRNGDENGYYTWPRFGFDGPLSDEIQQKLPLGLDLATNVLDLMRCQQGRQWWKAHGIPIRLAFDLADRSRSRRAFERYIRQPTRTPDVHKPGPPSAAISFNRKPEACAGSPTGVPCSRTPPACG